MLEQGLHSYLVGRSSTSVAETVYRHEIRPPLTKGPTAMNHILKAKAASLVGLPEEPIGSPIGSRRLGRKTHLTSRDGGN